MRALLLHLPNKESLATMVTDQIRLNQKPCLATQDCDGGFHNMLLQTITKGLAIAPSTKTFKAIRWPIGSKRNPICFFIVSDQFQKQLTA